MSYMTEKEVEAILADFAAEAVSYVEKAFLLPAHAHFSVCYVCYALRFL